jgi:NDP-sugar pyrophosphorylase family protein
MASNESKDILKAKQLLNEARRSSKIKAVKNYPLPKAKTQARTNQNSYENPWKKEQIKDAKLIEAKAKAIKNAKIAADKAKEAARVNTAKANAKNKMKAQGGKIGLSPTSSALERAKAKKGK